MSKTHIIKPGESLSKIAKEFYGTAHNLSKITEKLANYNGIRNLNLIKSGDSIEIPNLDELMEKNHKKSLETLVDVPNGLGEIIEIFGDPRPFLNDHKEWEEKILTPLKLPFQVPLSWDMEESIKKIKVHKFLLATFNKIFDELDNNSDRILITDFGGAYNFRAKRGGSKYSTHSWGIAIDLNTSKNPMGLKGKQPKKLIELFKDHGFKWGGDWQGRYKDPMHFQFCTGY